VGSLGKVLWPETTLSKRNAFAPEMARDCRLMNAKPGGEFLDGGTGQVGRDKLLYPFRRQSPLDLRLDRSAARSHQPLALGSASWSKSVLLADTTEHCSRVL
jgi:hypothetical protein